MSTLTNLTTPSLTKKTCGASLLKAVAISALILGGTLSAANADVSANAGINHSTNDAQAAHIRSTLSQAGLRAQISSITPSPIAGLLMVTLAGAHEPLFITADARYVIQGHIEANPSPAKPILKALQSRQVSGMPVTPKLKAALLDNMALLTNLDEHTVFYHSSIAHLLWGVSGSGGVPFLVSDDGRYFINGEVSAIIDGQFAGLDTVFEWAKNKHALSTLDPAQIITYPAKNPKSTIYVATDVHCPYCRLLHSQIPKLNAQGITVKIIGYPVYDESHQPMASIWCSDVTHRAKLLDQAMQGNMPTNQCSSTSPLHDNQLKAQALAITATPAIYHENGELFEGDFTGDALLQFAGVLAIAAH